MSQKSAQGTVPLERFNIEGFHSLNEGRDGAMKATGGYFIDEDVRLFDNHFFGINNLEAAYSKLNFMNISTSPPSSEYVILLAAPKLQGTDKPI